MTNNKLLCQQLDMAKQTTLSDGFFAPAKRKPTDSNESSKFKESWKEVSWPKASNVDKFKLCFLPAGYNS